MYIHMYMYVQNTHVVLAESEIPHTPVPCSIIIHTCIVNNVKVTYGTSGTGGPEGGKGSRVFLLLDMYCTVRLDTQSSYLEFSQLGQTKLYVEDLSR